MVHKKEEGTYHSIEKLTKEMPGFLSPWERLASPLNSWIFRKLIRNREFLTDPKQHTGSLLLNASWHPLNCMVLYICKVQGSTDSIVIIKTPGTTWLTTWSQWPIVSTSLSLRRFLKGIEGDWRLVIILPGPLPHSSFIPSPANPSL